MKDTELFEQFQELHDQGKSLREIAAALGITYYRSQQLFTQTKGRYMLNPITYKTIPLPYGHKGEATLRMLPYAMSAGDQTLEEARDELLNCGDRVPPMAIELQIQPNFWQNFDFDALYSDSRAKQLEMFNDDNQINLACFANAVSFQIGQTLMPYNYDLILAVLKDGFVRFGRNDVRSDAMDFLASGVRSDCGSNPLVKKLVEDFEEWVDKRKQEEKVK